jgi:hypothetical protein
MRRSKRLRVLGEIYNAVPSVKCKGLCAASCAGIPLTDVERERLEGAAGMLPRFEHGHAGISMLAPPLERCPLLVLSRCNAYEDRPLICRLFGVAKGLPCPYGCVPDRVLPDEEAHALVHRTRAL